MNGFKHIISAVILTLAAVGQIGLSFVYYKENGNAMIRNIGWIILWTSALFGWLPIFTLKKWGRVPKGKGYIHTHTLVDRGVYAIVRHPQYLAGILLGIGLSLIVQHWLVAVLGAVVAIISYAGTFGEEKESKQKFGVAYEDYMRRVPRINFISGIIKAVLVKKRS